MTSVLHVSPHGHETGDGTEDRPFRTISAAAAAAQPGDTVLVAAGTYRERIDPPRGGTSPDCRIVYTAAPDARVVLTGSDAFTTWADEGGGLWRLVVPSVYFGDFNPYAEVVHGDWFDDGGRSHRRGNVFLDGGWLPEAPTEAALRSGVGCAWTSSVDGLEDRPRAVNGVPEGHAAFDPARFDPDGSTTILARLPEDVDPNSGRVEVAVRPTVFTPTREHVDFITVRGFEIRNAATNWVAPTAGQQGMVTAYWNHGWVIEDNEICYSRCCGIALGKNSDEFDGERGTTEGYYLTIEDAFHRDGWSRETIGSHVVRNNRIHHCGQTGIVGSLGCAFSTIEDNEIHDCNVEGFWGGAEMGGIKLHGAIDVTIRGNHIHRCGEPAGIWLDWMAQGTRIHGNLMHDNMRDLFTEVSHGPIVITDNILLSGLGFLTNSRGVVFAHNLITGRLQVWHDDRQTPYLKPHSTEVAEMRRVCTVGDAHWLNNLLGPDVDLAEYDKADAELPCSFSGNARLRATAGDFEVERPISLEERSGAWFLTVQTDAGWTRSVDRLAMSSLGMAAVAGQAYTMPDGSDIVVDDDYFGHPRGARVTPGPFEPGAMGELVVWRSRRARWRRCPEADSSPMS